MLLPPDLSSTSEHAVGVQRAKAVPDTKRDDPAKKSVLDERQVHVRDGRGSDGREQHRGKERGEKGDI